jgi:hypothetical protein
MGNLLNTRSKYEAHNIDEVREKMKEFGICYVPDVLSDDERLEMISGTWDFFEHLTKNDDECIRRESPNTWSNIFTLCPNNHMLFHHWNAGHSQHTWNIRQNPRIVQIFADFWNCKPVELLSSFDGFAFLLPPEITDEGWYTPKSEFYHLDQSLIRPYFDGVQGFVTAYDIEEGDATLSFFEKSHKFINEYIEKFGIKTESDWCQFNDEEVNFFANNCTESNMKCPAKSLVLWDSRLVHSGTRPKKSRKNENTRCISYISYSKKCRINDQNLSKKIEGYENMLTSNHYAHRPSFFPTLPRNHTNITDYVVPINRPNVTNLGQSLIGYKVNEELINLEEDLL